MILATVSTLIPVPLHTLKQRTKACSMLRPQTGIEIPSWPGRTEQLLSNMWQSSDEDAEVLTQTRIQPMEPLQLRDLPEILNWRRLNDRITLSGQPTEEQLAAIKDLGVSHVINLGPHTNEGALDDEPGSVAALGMQYIYIPVDFEAPTDEDFAAFCAALEKLDGRQVHVHCIYNARVSAFFYRYAQSGRGGGSEVEANALMDGIWRPGGVWATFIGRFGDVDKPNQYAGYDY